MRMLNSWKSLGIVAVAGATFGITLGLGPSLGIRSALAQEGGEASDEAAEDSGEGAGASEGGAEDPDEGAAPTLIRDPNKRRWGVGARLRWVFLPKALIEVFVDHGTGMSSVGYGAEVITRKGDFDIVFGFEYEDIAPEAGLYLEKGDMPNSMTDGPDLVEFDGFGLLGLDVQFVQNARLTDKVALRYGGGVGVGLVLGDVLQTDYYCPGATQPSDLENQTGCVPVLGGKNKTPSDDVPPVVPIISALFGARFQVSDGFTLNFETGFRNMFYLGVSGGYLF
jgi:hypothetical protein